MWSGFPLFPERASTVAGQVDGLFLFLIGISLFFGLLIASTLVVFAIRFRRRSADERPAAIEGSLALELTWTLIPLAIVTVVFLWSAKVYFSVSRVPKDAKEIYVVGKRWMWKTQHMTGQREINELHVPVGVPVKLTITSEDVIHSFYIPAFRIKKDAVPGRYNTTWFQATKPGTYRLFCAEYCGTNHSRMIGHIVVLEPAQFETWLAGGPAPVSPVAAGEKLFTELNCITCHKLDGPGRGPMLQGLLGKPVQLVTGEIVKADENYVRESILNPAAKIVAGYQPIMPAYQGQVSEESVLQLIAYIRSLKAPAEGTAGASAPSSPAQGSSGPKP
jgi:cytochrome c oxidase subunit 2